MNKHKRHCVRICRKAGLHPICTQQRGKHWAVICEEGMVICPSTPSDRRFRHNLASSARRMARDF